MATRKTVKKTIRKIPSSEFPEKTTDSGKMQKILWIAAIVAVVAASGYFLKGFVFAAIVNGKPITRLQVISELEKQNGKRVLDNLVTQDIILQEADRQNISVNNDEIDAEIKNIEDNLKTQGQDINTVLTQQNMTKEELRKQIMIQKKIEKIVGKDLVVTDEEVTKYIIDNKDSLPKDATPSVLQADVKKQLEQQKMGEKFQTLLESLKAKAKINYFVQY